MQSQIDKIKSIIYRDYIKLKGLQQHFNDILGTISSIDDGALYLLIANDTAAGAAKITFTTRVRFWD